MHFSHFQMDISLDERVIDEDDPDGGWVDTVPVAGIEEEVSEMTLDTKVSRFGKHLLLSQRVLK